MKPQHDSIAFNYISSPAGSGKTQWAIEFSKKQNQRGINVLIIVPTQVLADNYAARSKGRIQSVHADNTEGPVVVRIQDIFRTQSMTAGSAISIAITERAFSMLSVRHGTDKWCLIKDEANEPLTLEAINCPDSKGLIQQWFRFEPLTTGLTSLRRAVTTSALPNLTDETDDVLRAIHHFKSCLSHAHLEVLVNTDKLQDEKPVLRYSVYVRPEMYSDFATCYFMAANFEHTFLFHQYKNSGVQWNQVEFQPDAVAVAPSARVSIHYWSELGGWSKYRRSKVHEGNKQTELERYLDWFKSRESGADYVYVTNNSVAVKLPGEKMPAICHGLNNWSHFTKVMSCASYLINKSDEQFYQHYGVSTTDARSMRNAQMLYQQVMRTDIRNYASSKPVDIYVPTLTEARELLMYLPAATIRDCNKQYAGQRTGVDGTLNSAWESGVGNIPAATSVHLNAVIAMSANTRVQQVTNISYEADITGQSDGIRYTFCRNNNAYYDPEKLYLIPNMRRPVGAPATSGSQVLRHIIALGRAVSLSGLDADAIKQAKLNDMPLFCTGQFPDGAGFHKSSCTGNNHLLAFDLDGTDITDKQIERTFLGCEHLTYTTASNDPEASLRRMRIVVVCDRTMSIEEHQRLMGYYSERLMALSEQHGLDQTKLTPWSKFYMPHKESIVHHVKRRKHPLNVDAVLEKLPRKAKIPVPAIEDLVFHYPQAMDTGVTTANVRVESLISQMRAGNRSTLAVKAAGIMGKCKLSPEQKTQYYEQMRAAGVDKAALKQVAKYAGMHAR